MLDFSLTMTRLIERTTLRKRYAILAGLSNVIVPPLGHVYVGSPCRGAAIFVGGLLGSAVLSWSGAATSLWSFYILQGLYLVVVLALVIDAVVLARRRKDYELKPYNKWYGSLQLGFDEACTFTQRRVQVKHESTKSQGNLKNNAANYRKTPQRAFAWRLLGIVVPMTMLFVWSALKSSGQGTIFGTWISGTQGVISILALLLIARFFLKARRHKAIEGEEKIVEDQRPPVLYLRSFLDDKSVVKGFMWLTEEEQWAVVMNEIGPFIAIGKPEEELPELGAARVYLDDEDWQAWIIAKMECAQLVILRTGETEGFWWELQQAGRVVNPERLLLLIDCDEPQYELFRQKAQNFLPGRLPDFRKTKIRCGSLRGIIYFERDWSSHFLTFKHFRFRGWAFRPITTTLKMCLQPVFQQLEIAWIPPNIAWLQMAFVTFFAVFLLFVMSIISLKIILKPSMDKAAEEYVKCLQSHPEIREAIIHLPESQVENSREFREYMRDLTQVCIPKYLLKRSLETATPK